MLNDFFRINLPYGIAKNANGDWMAFNREYRPIGYNEFSQKESPGNYSDLPIYTSYKKITEKLLLEIAEDENAIQRDKDGNIHTIFFYNDGSNPRNQSKDKPELWSKYFEKLRKLSKLEVKVK